jgi:hypothetical protein
MNRSNYVTSVLDGIAVSLYYRLVHVYELCLGSGTPPKNHFLV